MMLNNFNFHHLKNDLSLHLCGTYHGISIKVITVTYFKRCGEARRAEIISARLGLAWHVYFRRRKYSRAEKTLLMISNQR